MEEKPNHPVRTTAKTLDIIEKMATRDEVRISELAEELDIGKSGIHNHLCTLQERGYVVQEGEAYRLGLRFLEIGGRLRKKTDFFEVAEPEVDALAKETGELVNLMTEERGLGVYLKRAKGRNAVDLDTYAGHHVHLHCTALGKALLAYRPEEQVEKIIDHHGLPKRTDQTITERSKLWDDLKSIREQGYAIDNGERLEGLWCVAAPIKSKEDEVLGALSVSAPQTRMSEDQAKNEIRKGVQSAANVIELNVNY